jgi:hypothetical protein
MDDTQILEVLLELASETGVEVRIAGRTPRGAEEPPLASGVCKVRGVMWVVLSGAETVAVQIDVLAGALGRYSRDELEDRHLPPAVRARIDPEG